MTVDLPVEKPMTLARERFERIYKTIRDRICLLEYEPGARLGEEELAREFGVVAMPATILIDRDGNEAARLMGPADWASDTAKAVVNQLTAP